MSQNVRKWLSLVITLFLYYIVHEGAHLVVALLLGTFQSIRIAGWGLGVQIVADTDVMSDMQIFVFCIVGVVTTLIAGYALVWLRGGILASSSLLLRAVAYYTTLVFLCLDPLYLSVIHHLVGGGDFNGIVLIGIPKIVATVFFLVLLAVNVFIFIRFVYPSYKQRFAEEISSDNK